MLIELDESCDTSFEASLLRLGVLKGLGATLVFVDCANDDEVSFVFTPRRPPLPPLDVNEVDLFVERRWRLLRDVNDEPVLPPREDTAGAVESDVGGGFAYLFKFFPNFFFGSDEEEDDGCDEFM